MRRLLLGCTIAGLLAGCTPEIPDATYVCTTTDECPPGLFCDEARGLCVRDAPCTPLTCEDLRAECGNPDDRCGGTLDCGTCEGDETCGGGGVDLVCGCETLTCADAGATCGSVAPGCGAPDLNCGACAFPETCGGAGTPNECGCDAPDPCVGIECGDVVNACDEEVSCGDCPTARFCTAGVCGTEMCTPDPDPCATAGATCGTAPDGCGVLVSCGTCIPPETCMAGTCTCIGTSTCDGMDGECGEIVDECGVRSTCTGTCGERETCEMNQCVCVPDSLEDDDSSADATASVVTLGAGATVRIGDANIDATGDDDFFRWPFDTSESMEVDDVVIVQLSGIGVAAGDDYDLEAWVECDVMFSATTSCTSPATALSGRAGCGTGTPDATRETIQFRPGCAMGTLFVRVVATVGGNHCGPYDLEVMH